MLSLTMSLHVEDESAITPCFFRWHSRGHDCQEASIILPLLVILEHVVQWERAAYVTIHHEHVFANNIEGMTSCYLTGYRSKADPYKRRDRRLNSEESLLASSES